MLQGRCGGRSCSLVEGTHEGEEKHYRYESLGEGQNEDDNMMEQYPLEGVYVEWLNGELGRSYSDEMTANKWDNYTKGVTFGEDNQKIVTHYTYEQVRNKNELRKEQTKVTLFSMSRCFKLVNDGVFLLKMAYQLVGETEWKNIHQELVHKVAFIWLLSLYITSYCTFHLRKYFILNMIPEEHHDLFSLFGVFKKVMYFRWDEISILCFYSRMERTYMIMTKFLEDIPQFFLYLLYVWMNGGDGVLLFLFCVVCYWVLYVVIRVVYQGLRYPVVGATVRLFLSASLPEDAFIECDAAPTNKFFCLYAGAVFSVWSLVALATVPLVGAPWTALIYVQCVALLLVSMAFLLSFVYFHFGAKQRFYLNPYYCLRGGCGVAEWELG
ncbi:hypothetical protein PCYB_041220 [Plasmodium cynomolgi strain B]|uniref:Uncharacterized protein n=1 Tax=Plasmodium cynomolgi (strain B) TaxID=1120755 RepID=K6USI0_PLACD|nr:hypothetical protein PCYB_041220 [Plasmodium cynomolgi strain B]GAB64920.1 hypothetical protein PCYB_041220 [Plasmodium cynomolgi strain B]